MTEPTLDVPAANTATTRSAAWRSRDVLWLVIPAVSGVLTGLLWWVLAPGGLNVLSGNPALANPSNPDSWLPRDLVLAGIMLVAGCAAGLALDGKLNDTGAGRRLGFALGGGAVGAAVSWGLACLPRSSGVRLRTLRWAPSTVSPCVRMQCFCCGPAPLRS